MKCPLCSEAHICYKSPNKHCLARQFNGRVPSSLLELHFSWESNEDSSLGTKNNQTKWTPNNELGEILRQKNIRACFMVPTGIYRAMPSQIEIYGPFVVLILASTGVACNVWFIEKPPVEIFIIRLLPPKLPSISFRSQFLGSPFHEKDFAPIRLRWCRYNDWVNLHCGENELSFLDGDLLFSVFWMLTIAILTWNEGAALLMENGLNFIAFSYDFPENRDFFWLQAVMACSHGHCTEDNALLAHLTSMKLNYQVTRYALMISEIHDEQSKDMNIIATNAIKEIIDPLKTWSGRVVSVHCFQFFFSFRFSCLFIQSCK